MLGFLQIVHILLVLGCAGFYSAWIYFSPEHDEARDTLKVVGWSITGLWAAIIIVTTIIRGTKDGGDIKSLLIGHYRFLLTRFTFLIPTNIILIVILVGSLNYMASYSLVRFVSNEHISCDVQLLDPSGAPLYKVDVGPNQNFEARIKIGKYILSYLKGRDNHCSGPFMVFSTFNPLTIQTVPCDNRNSFTCECE